MTRNCMIGQSGGPTAAINASLAGVIKRATESKKFDTIYGSINGIQGVLQQKIISLNETFSNNMEAIETLKTSPAMYLGSCRYKLPPIEINPMQYDFIFENPEKYRADIKPLKNIRNFYKRILFLENKKYEYSTQ